MRMNMLGTVLLAVAGVALASLAAGTRNGPGVRVSERWGYDPVDATKFLQAALDSDEATIVIDRQPDDWHVTPLCLMGKANKTIVFEDGAYVRAKRGEFKSPYVPLIRFEYCTNVTVRGVGPARCGFRMWREDYHTTRGARNAKGYDWSEWRHCISLLSTVRLTLEGICASESGGDGLYISNAGRKKSTPGSGPDCVDTVVRNCVFDRNYRQGISVIGADGLLIEDTVMSNTEGTDPQDGIDFEPNGPANVLKRVVMRNCLATNNAHDGYDILTAQYDRTSEPVSMRFENCRSVGDRRGAFAYSNGAKDVDCPGDDGMIEVVGCRFERSAEPAVRLGRKPYSSGTFRMVDTEIVDCGAAKPDAADISLTVSGHPGCPADSYEFRNVTIRQTKARAPISYFRKDGRYLGTPTKLDGAIVTVADGKTERHVYDEAWRTANHPFDKVDKIVTRVPAARIAASLANVRVTDLTPGQAASVRPLFARGGGRFYVFYADRPKTVRLGLVETVIGKRKLGVAKPVKVYRYGAKDPLPGEYAPPPSPNGGVVEIPVPAKGFYQVGLNTMGNGLGIWSADVPVAIDVTAGLKGFVAPKNTAQVKYRDQGGDVWFAVAAGETFACILAGEGAETLGASVCDPGGKEAWKEGAISDVGRCQIEQAAGASGDSTSVRPRRASTRTIPSA